MENFQNGLWIFLLLLLFLGFLIPKKRKIKSWSKWEIIPKKPAPVCRIWLLVPPVLLEFFGAPSRRGMFQILTLPGIKFALGETLLGCSIPGWRGWNLGLKWTIKLLWVIINYTTDVILNDPKYPSDSQQKAGKNLGTAFSLDEKWEFSRIPSSMGFWIKECLGISPVPWTRPLWGPRTPGKKRGKFPHLFPDGMKEFIPRGFAIPDPFRWELPFDPWAGFGTG